MTGYEVYAVRTGTLTTTYQGVFLNYAVHGLKDQLVDMDYFFWVVRDKDHTILVDTGFDPGVGVRRGRTPCGDLATGLAALDLGIGDVDQLVITHAHYDHIGNLPALGEILVVMAAAEYEFWTGPIAGRAQFGSLVEGRELAALERARVDGRLELVENRYQVLPGLWFEPVGGHTPGQSIVHVDLSPAASDEAPSNRPPAQRAVLASDALHYNVELQMDRLFTFTADVISAYRAVDRLRELQGQPGTILVPGHDPAVGSSFKPAGDHRRSGDNSYAVRIV